MLGIINGPVEPENLKIEDDSTCPSRPISEKPSGQRDTIVGIVAFNTPILTLDKTIHSLGESNIPIFTVVLCNSANQQYQQDVEAICKKYHVKFFGNQKNKGFGAGHNLIVRTFPSKWYICCNPDVIVRSNTIKELLNFGESHREAILLMPRVLSEDGSIQPLARRTLTPLRWLYRQAWRGLPSLFRPFELRFDYYRTQPVDFVTGSFFAVKQSSFIKIGGFDEDFFLYSEDADLSYRAKLTGINYYVASAEITHIWMTNRTRSYKTIIQELSSLMRYFNKHNLWFRI